MGSAGATVRGDQTAPLDRQRETSEVPDDLSIPSTHGEWTFEARRNPREPAMIALVGNDEGGALALTRETAASIRAWLDALLAEQGR
jgi:hypothetical protein